MHLQKADKGEYFGLFDLWNILKSKKKNKFRNWFQIHNHSLHSSWNQEGAACITFFSWGVDNEDEDQGDGSEDHDDQGSEGDDGGR